MHTYLFQTELIQFLKQFIWTKGSVGPQPHCPRRFHQAWIAETDQITHEISQFHIVIHSSFNCCCWDWETLRALRLQRELWEKLFDLYSRSKSANSNSLLLQKLLTCRFLSLSQLGRAHRYYIVFTLEFQTGVKFELPSWEPFWKDRWKNCNYMFIQNYQ